MRLIVSGGGTGGHFFPALEILKKAKERKVETLYVGATRGIERKLEGEIPGEKLFLETYPLRGVTLKERLRALRSFFGGISELRRSVEGDFRSLIFGGYVSVPVGVFTLIRREPLYIHEQNSVPSMTNRTLFAFSKKAFITFEYTRRFFKGKKVVKTGLPVRRDLLNFRMERGNAKEAIGADPDKPLVLFMGGSQGAKFLNSLAVEVAKASELQILLLSGERDHERVLEMSRGIENLKVFPFRTDMGLIYSASDVAVCRSGAGTISELSIFRIPAIFIPYPYAAGDHQYYNAKEIEDLGGAFVLRQEDTSPQKVLALIDKALQSTDSMAVGIGKFASPKAADLIIDEILQD